MPPPPPPHLLVLMRHSSNLELAVWTRLACEPPDLPALAAQDCVCGGSPQCLAYTDTWTLWSVLYPPNRVFTPISLVSSRDNFFRDVSASFSFLSSLPVPCVCSGFLLSLRSPPALLSSAIEAFCCVCYFMSWCSSSGFSSWFEELISSSQSSFSVRNGVFSPLKTQAVSPEQLFHVLLYGVRPHMSLPRPGALFSAKSCVSLTFPMEGLDIFFQDS